MTRWWLEPFPVWPHPEDDVAALRLQASPVVIWPPFKPGREV